MELTGLCVSMENRDKKTGIVTLQVIDLKTQKKVTAMGAISIVSEKKKYLMTGEYDSAGIFRFGRIRRTSESIEESVQMLVSRRCRSVKPAVNDTWNWRGAWSIHCEVFKGRCRRKRIVFLSVQA